MFIMSEREDHVVNSDFVIEFYRISYSDSAVIYAAVPSTERALVLSRYKDTKEADDALGQLFYALVGGATHFYMPASRYYSEERIIKDARVKRKGGS